MNKHNTIPGQMPELVSRSHFEKLVKEHKTEHGAKGLRSIEQGMNSRAGSLYHPGIPADRKRIKRSNLSYANNRRSSGLFKGVFEKLPGEAQGMKSPHGFRFKNPLYSIDSTTMDLCMKLFPQGESGYKTDRGIGSSRENTLFRYAAERAAAWRGGRPGYSP